MIKTTGLILAISAGIASAAMAQTAPASAAAVLVAAVEPAAAASPEVAVAPAVATPAVPYETEVVCKTELETGSLVKKVKTCKTRRKK